MTEQGDDIFDIIDSLPARQIEPWAESAQGIREAECADGFTGTLRDYLDWLEEMLMYGGFHLSAPEEDERGRRCRKLELITAGFSTDERLISRAYRGWLSQFWESSHAGGLFVFRIPEDHLESQESWKWMEPTSAPFEEIHLVEKLILPNGEEIAVEAGKQKVTLSFEEYRGVAEPSGWEPIRRTVRVEILDS